MNNVINDNVCDSLRFERWGLNVDVDSLNGKLTFSRICRGKLTAVAETSPSAG